MFRFRSNNPQKRIAEVLEQYGDQSRLQLVKHTGIPRPRLSTIIQNMLDTGAISISELVKSDGRGRPTELLTLNAHTPQYVGLSLQHQTSCIVVINALYHPIIEVSQTNPDKNLRERINSIWNATQAKAATSEISLAQIQRIGCALPGLMPNPLIHSNLTPAVEAARTTRSVIADITGITPVICGTTPASAVAEMRMHTDLEHCLYVRVSDGVAASIIAEGQLITGSRNIPGEIGHITVDPNGHPCVCGKHGCLETIISTPAICRNLNLSSIHAAAEAWEQNYGDTRAYLRNAAQTLGMAIANAAMITDPGTVVIAWSLSHQIPELLQCVREGMREALIPALRNVVRIIPALMPEATAAARGAATWPTAMCWSEENN